MTMAEYQALCDLENKLTIQAVQKAEEEEKATKEAEDSSELKEEPVKTKVPMIIQTTWDCETCTFIN